MLAIRAAENPGLFQFEGFGLAKRILGSKSHYWCMTILIRIIWIWIFQCPTMMIRQVGLNAIFVQSR